MTPAVQIDEIGTVSASTIDDSPTITLSTCVRAPPRAIKRLFVRQPEPLPAAILIPVQQDEHAHHRHEAGAVDPHHHPRVGFRHPQAVRLAEERGYDPREDELQRVDEEQDQEQQDAVEENGEPILGLEPAEEGVVLEPDPADQRETSRP
jgi:hypothetical protein